MTKLGPQVLELRQHTAVVGKLYNKSGTVYNSGEGEKITMGRQTFYKQYFNVSRVISVQEKVLNTSPELICRGNRICAKTKI